MTTRIRAFTRDTLNRRTRDQGTTFAEQVGERLDRIEQAIIALVQGDDDDAPTEDSIDIENRTSKTEQILDPGYRYGTSDHWRGIDKRTNQVIRNINQRNRQHYGAR